MPIIKNVRTTSIEGEPYTIPGTDITITRVKLELDDGTRTLYSTMSRDIATIGWSGDIETYINDKGREYVRQAPKEVAPAGGSPASSSSRWGKSAEELDSIHRCNAMNNAVASYATGKVVPAAEDVVARAQVYYDWMTNPAGDVPDPQWDQPVIDPDTGSVVA